VDAYNSATSGERIPQPEHRMTTFLQFEVLGENVVLSDVIATLKMISGEIVRKHEGALRVRSRQGARSESVFSAFLPCSEMY
jgi:hypothetical protein